MGLQHNVAFDQIDQNTVYLTDTSILNVSIEACWFVVCSFAHKTNSELFSYPIWEHV